MLILDYQYQVAQTGLPEQYDKTKYYRLATAWLDADHCNVMQIGICNRTVYAFVGTLNEDDATEIVIVPPDATFFGTLRVIAETLKAFITLAMWPRNFFGETFPRGRIHRDGS